MLSRKYAERIIGPQLTTEFAAQVINGEVLGGHIWYNVCALAGGWCNDANVFLAWDAMGRPDESEYLDPDYYSVRSPERRRAMIANARISAMSELVADTLIGVVEGILVRDGWTIRPASEAEADTVGWIENGCDALGFAGEGYLIKPEGK